MFATAALLGIPALGITDRNSLAGIIRAHEAAKVTGVRLIVGCRLDFEDFPSLLVYPTDRAAYSRLCRLLTLGKSRSGKGKCTLRFEDVTAWNEGLIAILVTDKPSDQLEEHLARLKVVFRDRAYCGLTRRFRPDDLAIIDGVAGLAAKAKVKTVVTGDILYHAPACRMLQDVVTCIRLKTTIDKAGFLKERHADRFLKPPAEIARLFAAYPDAVARASKIAARCKFSLDELTYRYPTETVEDGLTAQERLEELTWAGAEWRYPDGLPDDVAMQLRHELNLIQRMDYAPYFLTVNAIVQSRGRRTFSVRAAAPPPIPLSASCSASPRSIRCGRDFCSNASCRKSAVNRPISMSISSMSDARRSFSRQVIEWDKDDIDALKFMKVDVLGLGMLGCMRRAFELLKASKGIDLDLATIPAEDPATYAMIQKADTIGVFQIGNRAQMSMLPRLAPKRFYDLVIEVAIVRPGPIQGDMVHPYLRRREGKEKVEYPKPELERVLGKTLGVPLFQEQAMQVAMVAAGFSATEADQLRRAMATFKFTGGVTAFRDKLIQGMIDNGYEPAFAERTFKQLEGFGSYGFPESHAASFALIAYASSWMKCRHPDAFCTAILNAQPMGFTSRRSWCATPATMALRYVRSTSTPPNGTALWSRLQARTKQFASDSGWSVDCGKRTGFVLWKHAVRCRLPV